MAVSTIVKNLTDGKLTLKDGTGSPVVLVVGFDMGDFTVSGLAQSMHEVAAYESRGVFKSARRTTRRYASGSFSLMLTDISDGTDQTVIDYLLKQGSYAANVSTLAGDVYCVDLVFDVEGTDLGDSADHSITLTKCHCVVDVSEGDPDTIAVSYTAYGTVTMT